MNAMRRPSGADARARIVTKGGMTRVGGGWVPDGRAKALRADCEASLTALDGLPIDLYLIHAPDPRTPWRTSLRALERLLSEGLVRHVGVSNVNRRLLDARTRRRARREARGGRPASRARQHVPHSGRAELRRRGGEPPRRVDAL